MNREAQKRKMEEHKDRLISKVRRIGMLEEILTEQESRPFEEQDVSYICEVKLRLRRTQAEFQNMNQV